MKRGIPLKRNEATRAVKEQHMVTVGRDGIDCDGGGTHISRERDTVYCKKNAIGFD